MSWRLFLRKQQACIIMFCSEFPSKNVEQPEPFFHISSYCKHAKDDCAPLDASEIS